MLSWARRHPLLILLILAAVLRLGVFVVFLAHGPETFTSPDSERYRLLGENLADHGTFRLSAEPGAPAESYRTPGYPAFLALLFGVGLRSPAWIALIQIALSLLTIAVVCRLVGESIHSYAGLAAALLLAVSPGQIHLGNLVLSESLFTFLWVTSLWLAWRSAKIAAPPLAAASGLLLGLSVLVRPFGVFFFPIVIVGLLLLHRRSPGKAALVVVCWLLLYSVPVEGWKIRNELQAGSRTLTSIGGYNLLVTRAGSVRMLQTGADYETVQEQLYAELDRRGEGLDWTDAQRAEAATEMALEIIGDHPGRFALGAVQSFARLHLGGGSSLLRRLLGGRAAADSSTSRPKILFVPWVAGQLLFLGLLYALALVGAVALVRRRAWTALLVYALTVAYPAVLLFGACSAHSRYRVPYEPAWAALAGAGLAAFAFRFRPSDRDPAPLGAEPRAMICIPVYNEVAKIRRLLDRFDFDASPRVVVVDDASDDGTEKVVTRYPVHVIRHERNRGVGACIRDAIHYGREQGFSVIVVMAGNDKDDPAEAPALVRPLVDDGMTYVQGSRFLEAGHHVNTPRGRLIAILGYTGIFNLFSPAPCTDLTNGFRAYRLDLFDDPEIDIDQPWLDRYEMEYYIHFKAIMHGHPVTEVPVHKRYPAQRTEAYSKIQTLRDWWQIVRPMLFLFLRYKR